MLDLIIMTELYFPPIVAPKLGDGELHGGYYEWCVEREKWAPIKYTLRRHDSLLFSIIVPVHNPEHHWLQQCIDSVRGQFFADWELILSDDASGSSTLAILEKNQLIDDRITVICSEQQSGISATTNRAAELAKGYYLVFLDHDDMLDAYALSAFAQQLKNKSDTDILYADEDRFDDHFHRFHPGFKPQFSLEKFLCSNYIHHPVVMRRSLFNELEGFDSQYDGSQDYDLLLRAIEKTTKIEHIPDVLYHMRLHSGSLSSGAEAKPGAHAKGLLALQAYLDRQSISAIISPTQFSGYQSLIYPVQQVSVSILLMVDKNINLDDIKSYWQRDENDEILICNNTKATIPQRLNKLAEKSRGEVLIFADGQLQPEIGCLDELIGNSIRKNSGLVTGKLVYQDDRLHSCGLTLGIRGSAGYWHYGCDSNDLGYGGWMAINHEVSAVPWQLMAVKKELFIKAGLFDCQYDNKGFDVHLSLQLLTNHSLKHLAIAGAKAVFPYLCPSQPVLWSKGDFIYLWKNWLGLLNKSDPFFNPNFSIVDESICFFGSEEKGLKNMGGFNAYDGATSSMLWECIHFNE